MAMSEARDTAGAWLSPARALATTSCGWARGPIECKLIYSLGIPSRELVKTCKSFTSTRERRGEIWTVKYGN